MSKPSMNALRGARTLARGQRIAPRAICCSRPAPQLRGISSNILNDNDSSQRKGLKISHVFGGLVGLGMLVTIYGLLEYYFMLDTWPTQVRTPLKAAIKARNSGDYDRSETYFRKAIDAANLLPLSALEPDPLLKLSGLYSSLAAMLESQGQLVKAYVELTSAIDLFGDSNEDLRRIALSQKLGQLALDIASSPSPPSYPSLTSSPSSWDSAAEHYLSSALTQMLKLGLKDRQSKQDAPVVTGKDVQLPETEAGISRKGLGMTMEALSEVYARRGQYDLAGQLLIQSVSTLLPPGSKEPPPVTDRCQAALLMTTISSHALQPRTSQAIKSAKSWSLQALQIADQALSEVSTPDAICQRAKSVGLYNLGMLAELEADLPAALSYFNRALSSSRESGFSEGKREASEAIRRIGSLSRGKA
ncbi:hypothetical protein P7C73_g4073, partial [Tremellales sp. Uapishka_1]